MDPEIAKQITAEVTKQLQVSGKQLAAPDINLMILYALILALFIALPTIIDILYAYHSRNKSWQLILQEAGKNQLDKDELQALIKSTAEGPPGISGMSRSLMAFAVIIILGIAVFHLLATQGSDNEIVKNVLSMLAATLASITGFYFGGKSAEVKKEAPSTAPPGAPPAAPPAAPPPAPPAVAPPPAPALAAGPSAEGAATTEAENAP